MISDANALSLRKPDQYRTGIAIAFGGGEHHIHRRDDVRPRNDPLLNSTALGTGRVDRDEFWRNSDAESRQRTHRRNATTPKRDGSTVIGNVKYLKRYHQWIGGVGLIDHVRG